MPPNPDEKPMNSKFEFWNELPNEMRMECIKRMDFKARMGLRAASKQDKLLVESSPKYHFDSVQVDLDVIYGSRVICKKSDRFEVKIQQKTGEKTPEFLGKVQQLVVQILKFSTSKTMDFTSNFRDDNDVAKFLADNSNSVPFHFKKLTLSSANIRIGSFFLKNCVSLESIRLVRPPQLYLGTETTEFPHFSTIINVRTTQLIYWAPSEMPYQIISEMLKRSDLSLGKTVQIFMSCDLLEPQLMDFLAEKFENRVVSKTEKTLRINTNDSKKHILITILRDKFFGSNYSYLIIPSDQKESEYEKDDEWIKEMNEWSLERIGNDMRNAFDSFSDRLKALSDDNDEIEYLEDSDYDTFREVLNTFRDVNEMFD